MNIDELKKAIQDELKECNDSDLLLDVLLRFYPYPGTEKDQKNQQAAESETTYTVNTGFQIPDWKWKQLEEESQKLKRGTLELTDWVDFESELRKEYGL